MAETRVGWPLGFKNGPGEDTVANYHGIATVRDPVTNNVTDVVDKYGSVAAAVVNVHPFFRATGGGSGLVADGVPAPWAVASHHKMTCSLNSDYGVMPQFARATLSGARPFIASHDGRVVQPKQGECCFYRARRVENLLRYTSNLPLTTFWQISGTGAAIAPVYDTAHVGPRGLQNAFLLTRGAEANSVWRTKDGVVLANRPHVYSIWLKAGSASQAEIRMYISGGASLVTKVVTLTDEWQRFAITGTPNGSSAYVIGVSPTSFASTAGGTIYVADPQLEHGSVPSEFVSVDETPVGRFWHGAAVDGVQYFDTINNRAIESDGRVTGDSGDQIDGVVGVMTFASAINQFTDNGVAAAYPTLSRMTLTESGGVSPRGINDAMLMSEGTDTGTHQAFRTLAGVGAIALASIYSGACWHNYSVFIKPGADAPPFVRLIFKDTNGVTTSAFVNTATGAAGDVTGGYLNVEMLADGWMRVMWSVRASTGAGSADPLIGIGFANTSSAGTSYVGTNRSILIWAPCYYTSTSTGGLATAQRPIAPPATIIGASAETLPGQGVAFSVRGILGKTDFAIASTYYPYYRIEQPDKAMYGATTYMLTEAPGETRGTVIGNLNFHRCGISIRPPLSGGANNCKFAYDFYSGDSNNLYFWKPNTEYPAGSFVIPTDTQPLNLNSRKMFVAVVGGVSGETEPAWNTTWTATPDTTSNLTVDGSVRWQNNINNGINGTYETYSGAEILADQGFLGQYKAAWFVQQFDYGVYINGVELHQQTEPRPLFPDRGYVLGYRPKTLFLGGMGNASSQWPEIVPAGLEHAQMPPHTAIHRDVIIWHTAPTADVIQAATL